MFKKIIKSNGFKIYVWPAGLCLVYCYALMLIFALTNKSDHWLFEPGSLKEVVFVAVGDAALLLYLWIITYRYKKIKKKPVNNRTKVMLTIITIAYLHFLISSFYFDF